MGCNSDSSAKGILGRCFAFLSAKILQKRMKSKGNDLFLHKIALKWGVKHLFYSFPFDFSALFLLLSCFGAVVVASVFLLLLLLGYGLPLPTGLREYL